MPPYWIHGAEGPDEQQAAQTWTLCTRCHDLLIAKDLDQLSNHIALSTFLRIPALATGPDEDQRRVLANAQTVATTLSVCLDAGELVSSGGPAGKGRTGA